MRVTAFVFAMLLAAGTALGQEDYSPHIMTTPDGELDFETCAACHEPGMGLSPTLSRTKAETCTLCHVVTHHSGAVEHLRAGTVSLAKRRPTGGDDVVLPLTEDGRIYCGTCHVFHDPALGRETLLLSAQLPASTGLPAAVRRAREAQWEQVARKYEQAGPGARFSLRGTKALRLPVVDGSLCLYCHEFAK